MSQATKQQDRHVSRHGRVDVGYVPLICAPDESQMKRFFDKACTALEGWSGCYEENAIGKASSVVPGAFSEEICRGRDKDKD